MPAVPAPWYRDGLRFSCTRCGNCCTGAPGNIWVSEDEIAALAQRVGLDATAFRARYTRTVRGRGVSLIEKQNNDCVFWQKGKGCTVYDLRPRQCRTWPFWRPLLEERESWDAAARGCPGMNRGELHPASEIAEVAADDGLPG